jgi:Mannosyl-glycoprotein endo-beta-N-acetylglucosaminidase
MADISPFIKDAQRIQDRTGIPASIILGQIMLESSGSYAGGLSGLAYEGKNLFGVKEFGNGPKIYMPTKEYQNGRMVTVNAAFRKYDSYYDSMLDHAELLSKERYAKHLKSAKSINDFAAGIKAGGYATDPSYVSKLLGIISSNDLHQYDTSNFSFTPVSSDGASSSPSGGGEESVIDSIMVGTVRFVLVLLVFILGVIFFMKAFPGVSEVTNMVPAKKVMNVAKKVKGVKKVAETN